ncbi:MAG: YqgE/AlgH family protein [Bacteroidales bacterium]|nr:YqgE/AlgH family protein [Bacteroidales bacterium]
MDLKKLFQIRSNTLEPQQGNILLSEPTMNDFHFGRSVVLLIEHNESEGSFGIIMNKSLNVRLKEIVDVFEDFDAPVYLGGPVAENQIFFMHTLGDLIPDSCKIMDGLYWGGDTDTLNTLIAQGIANKNNVRFFLGYSGWSAGQLTSELARNSWLVGKTNSKLLLSTPTDQMWKTFVARMGKEYEMWQRFPKNPEEN